MCILLLLWILWHIVTCVNCLHSLGTDRIKKKKKKDLHHCCSHCYLLICEPTFSHPLFNVPYVFLHNWSVCWLQLLPTSEWLQDRALPPCGHFPTVLRCLCTADINNLWMKKTTTAGGSSGGRLLPSARNDAGKKGCYFGSLPGAPPARFVFANAASVCCTSCQRSSRKKNK